MTSDRIQKEVYTETFPHRLLVCMSTADPPEEIWIDVAERDDPK